ncbi:MAG: PD-(D/E)XK nuclease family protein [Sedimentisphaerales bacterium]|nr:PD-(D/E)XK nuclease family protein [Sedimentisphaerales bacterium]
MATIQDIAKGNKMEQLDIRTKRDLIDRFLADNLEFEELAATLSKFNVFSALKITDAEIRHSNVLAWLLNPKESHGLGDIILRRVFSNVLLETEKDVEGLSAAEVELMDFVDIEIRREWRHIDLLIIDRNNKVVILIENKIKSGESPGQLSKYQQTVESEFPSFVLVPIFLTLNGIESTDKKAQNYISYNYIQLLSVLEAMYHQRESEMAESVAMFIKHYIETLRRITMQDERMVDLCKTIYRKHREAIDMVVEYGKTGVLQQAVEDVLSEDGEYELLSSRPCYVWFLPLTWTRVIPENGIAWKHLKRPVSIACWIEYYNNDISIHLELSKMDDPELRLSCVKKLQEAGFKFSKKAFDVNATYSRFFGASSTVSDMSDYEKVREAVEKLLKKAKAEFPKAQGVFNEVFGKHQPEK